MHRQTRFWKEHSHIDRSIDIGRTDPKRRSRRRGAVGTEYVIVCSAILAFVLSSFFFLQGNLMVGFDRLSDSMVNPTEIHSIDDTTSVSAESLKCTSSQSPSQQQRWSSIVFVVASSFFVCLLSFLYLKQTRKAAQAEPEFCQVTQLELRSKALVHVLEKRASIQKYLRDDLFKLFVGDVPISDFMSTKLRTVQPDDHVEKIYAILEEFGCRRVMVVDDEGKLLGIVSHKDLSKRKGEYARELMSTSLKTVAPNFGLSNAITIMLQQKLTCIPVLDQERLVGILTASDLMMILQCVLVTLNKFTMESKVETNRKSQNSQANQPISGAHA